MMQRTRPQITTVTTTRPEVDELKNQERSFLFSSPSPTPSTTPVTPQGERAARELIAQYTPARIAEYERVLNEQSRRFRERYNAILRDAATPPPAIPPSEPLAPLVPPPVAGVPLPAPIGLPPQILRPAPVGEQILRARLERVLFEQERFTYFRELRDSSFGQLTETTRRLLALSTAAVNAAGVELAENAAVVTAEVVQQQNQIVAEHAERDNVARIGLSIRRVVCTGLSLSGAGLILYWLHRYPVLSDPSNYQQFLESLPAVRLPNPTSIIPAFPRFTTPSVTTTEATLLQEGLLSDFGQWGSGFPSLFRRN